MAKKTDTFDYAKKAQELEQLLGRLQDPEIGLEEASKLHANGLQLVTELEAYLKTAENEISRHSAK